MGGGGGGGRWCRRATQLYGPEDSSVPVGGTTSCIIAWQVCLCCRVSSTRHDLVNNNYCDHLH